MIRTKTPLLLLCALAFLSAPALAGPLAIDTTAMATWHGSSSFQGYYDPPTNSMPSGLSGHIDWAVWAPDTFPDSVTEFTGYTPTAGEYVYTYQLFVEGTAPLSQNIVVAVNASDNIGDFTGDNGFGTVSGISPSSSSLVPYSSAEWTFSPGIATGESSVGLAFSSPNAPEMSSSLQIDDGTIAFAMVPAPGAPNVPEPGSLALASCGLGMLVTYWLRRRSRATT